MLTNVILNALDAMPDGGQLHITTETDGDNVIVFVRDTGTGMTDETRRRALEPFFTTKVDVGSGLGLATVRGTVEGWRGRVDIDSQLGVGTTVRLTIPAAERQLAAMLQVEMGDGRSASEHLIAKLLDEARHGEPWAMKLALDRILPAVQKVEHAVQGEPRSPRFVCSTTVGTR